MADNFKIGAGLSLDGEAEFKKAVAGINKDLTVLGSEMKKVTAQFDGNADSLEALTAKQDVYNKRAEEQRKKIEVMTAALESAKTEFGENSDKVKDWQIKLNNAEADLAKTENALQKTTDQIDSFGKEANDSGNEVEKAGNQAKASGDDAEKGQGGWGKLGDGLKNAGKLAGEAVLALGAAAVGAAAGIGGMTVKAAYAADDINTMSKQTGLSVEEIQKFQYASEQIDVSMDTLTGSMAKLTKNMESARQGSKNQKAAFDALGISITDNEGNLRSNQDVFSETINALGQMENETQRDAYAMQIFGKSAQDLNPLILGGAEALEELGAEAEAAGLILGQDSLDNLNLLSDAMDTFKATASGSGSLFATAFAAPMAEGLNTITGYMHDLTTAFRDGGFDGLADKAGEVLADLINKITEHLPRVIDLGMNVITKLIEGIVQNVPALVNGAVTIVVQLTNSLLEMLPMLIDAGLQVIVTLALGIAQALPELIPTMVETMLLVVDTLIENIDLLVDASPAIIVALATGLIDALPKLAEKVPEIIIKIVSTLIENLPKVFAAGWDIIKQVGAGIINFLGELISPAGEIVTKVVQAISNKFQDIKDIGRRIVEGIWDGIKGAYEWIYDQLKGWVKNVIQFIKDLLGIKSPSKVFAKIGSYMAQGLGVGFEGEMNSVAKKINASIPTNIQMQSTYGAVEGLVNALPTISGNQGGGVYHIHLDVDGRTVATTIFDPLRSVAKQKGVALA